MNVLFVSGIGGDTRRYRCLHHQEQLALRGIASELREPEDSQIYVDATTCDAVILHRVPWQPIVADLVEIAHLRGKPAIFETDDLVFLPELVENISYLDTLPPDAAARFRTSLAQQTETFAHCDCVLTTTTYLAGAAAARGKPAYVQRNAFSAEMVQAAETAYALRRLHDSEAPDPDKPILLGYFSGTGSHNRDFATIAPVVADLMARYPQVWLHLSGHLDVGGVLLAYHERIRRAPYLPWQELPQLIAQMDINLAPLELDNPFCQAKSEIKYTEAALVGVPTVASPTEAFAFAIEDGKTGFLVHDLDDWRRALAMLIERPELRRCMGEAARAAVYAAYLPEERSRELAATLETIAARHATPAADPIVTASTVAYRMKLQLDRHRATQNQLHHQLEQLRETLTRWEAQEDGKGATFWRQNLEESQRRQAATLREILERLQRRGS